MEEITIVGKCPPRNRENPNWVRLFFYDRNQKLLEKFCDVTSYKHICEGQRYKVKLTSKVEIQHPVDLIENSLLYYTRYSDVPLDERQKLLRNHATIFEYFYRYEWIEKNLPEEFIEIWRTYLSLYQTLPLACNHPSFQSLLQLYSKPTAFAEKIKIDPYSIQRYNLSSTSKGFKRLSPKVLKQMTKLIIQDLGYPLGYFADKKQFQDIYDKFHGINDKTGNTRNLESYWLSSQDLPPAVKLILDSERKRYELGVVVKKDEAGTWFALAKHNRIEQSLFNNLNRLIRSKARLKPTVKEDSLCLDHSQQAAVDNALWRPLTVITGHAGTGKSKVLGDIIRQLRHNRMNVLYTLNMDYETRLPTNWGHSCAHSRKVEALETGNFAEIAEDVLLFNICALQFHMLQQRPADLYEWKSELPKIVIAAPTGKAATELSRKLEFNPEVSTIASLFHSKSRYDFIDILVIDEVGMADQQHLNALISRAGWVVLSGDEKQLPSISPGQFLKDTKRICKPHGCLKQLSTIHRNAGGGQAIAELALEIANHSPTDADIELDIKGKVSVCRVQLTSDNSQIATRVISVAKHYLRRTGTLPMVISDCNTVGLCAINGELRKLDPLQPELKKGLSNSISLPLFQTSGKRKRGLKYYKWTIHESEQVMCIKNRYVTKFGEREREASNGQIGRVEATEANCSFVYINGTLVYRITIRNNMIHFDPQDVRDKTINGILKDTQDTDFTKTDLFEMAGVLPDGDKEFRINVPAVKVKFEGSEVFYIGDNEIKANIRPGYAYTIHKAQGSEADSVICILSKFPKHLKEITYTGVTRAKKELTLILASWPYRNKYRDLMQARACFRKSFITTRESSDEST